jgi:hypothetical protein
VHSRQRGANDFMRASSGNSRSMRGEAEITFMDASQMRKLEDPRRCEIPTIR